MIKKIIDVSMMGEVLTNGGWLVYLLLVIFQTFMLLCCIGMMKIRV